MSLQRIISRERRLDTLFAKVSELDFDAEMQAHWARYLCVLCSGYLESSLRDILYEYVRGRTSTQIRNFVNSRLQDFQNPKFEKIKDLLTLFDAEWAKLLDESISQDVKDAINSIVANRHQIAHGADVGISFKVINDYY
jgi:hypothetical protein